VCGVVVAVEVPKKHSVKIDVLRGWVCLPLVLFNLFSCGLGCGGIFLFFSTVLRLPSGEEKNLPTPNATVKKKKKHKRKADP
jgi:hypothetical protein